MNNHILANVDTDSFSVCKPDQTEWTAEQKKQFLDYINSHFPEKIRWADDGEYLRFLVVKSKNYAMRYFDKKEKKVVTKIKGSSLKDQKRAKILLKYTEEFVNLLLDEQNDKLVDLYHSYVRQILSLEDIAPWCKKLTVTDKIIRCKGYENLSKEQLKEKGIRQNESKVYEAIKHTDFQEGNKIYVFFREDLTYCLAEEFEGDYDKVSLFRQLYNVTKVFKTVLEAMNFDFTQFINYSLKKQKKQLEKLK